MTLTLIESNGPNILPVILQAPHTSSLNILTSTRLYCFYPTLFASSKGIRMKHWIRFYSPFSHFNFGLQIYRTTSIWIDAPCGDTCPSLWQHTKDLPGVGLVRWGTLNGNLDLGNKTPSKSDGFEKNCFLWKTDGQCINPLCPNQGREVDLLEIEDITKGPQFFLYNKEKLIGEFSQFSQSSFVLPCITSIMVCHISFLIYFIFIMQSL